jgi:Type I restriction-modification system methyltransferase subunit
VKGAIFVIPTPKLLDQVMQVIDKIQMDDRDTKGDLYEYLLSKIATTGRNGEFRTPWHIIKTMVAMMQLNKEDTLYGPAYGTAVFWSQPMNISTIITPTGFISKTLDPTTENINWKRLSPFLAVYLNRMTE